MNTPASRLGDRLLQPVEWDAFFAEYWEQKPLHISREDPACFSDCLSMDSLESLLSTQTLYYPDVQVTQQGVAPAPESYTDEHGAILPMRLFGQYAAGATVIVSQAHRHIDSLARLRRELLGSLQLNCQTNVYLSPDGKQGFNPHYDAHDVLILQIAGSKRFRFYEGGVALPMSYQRFDSASHKAGALLQEIVLQAGDTLYIPRGHMHDAVAMPGSPSLHVTVGVFPVGLTDLFRELIQIQSERESASRQSIPRELWVPGEAAATASATARQSLDELLASLSSTLAAPDRLDEALRRLRDAVAMKGAPDCRGAGSLPLAENALAPETLIALRRGVLINSERHDDQLIVRTAGQVLEFSGVLAKAVCWLIDRQGVYCRLADIPHLEDDRAIALCRSLMQANLLTIQQT